MSDVCSFGACPWVKLEPGWMYQSDTPPSSEFVVSEQMAGLSGNSTSSLNPLSRAAEAALEKHRMQGHVPFDPRCTICARGKSTFQHRRRREEGLETEVQADFGFITTRGELVSDECADTIKVLCLAELSTGCVGYVVCMKDKDMRHVKSQVCKFVNGWTISGFHLQLHPLYSTLMQSVQCRSWLARVQIGTPFWCEEHAHNSTRAMEVQKGQSDGSKSLWL